MQGITEKIKELAKAQRLSIRQIEIAAGLSNGAIARWSEKSPSIDKVYRVANVLGCTVDDLIRDDPDADEQESAKFHASVEEVAQAMNKTPEQLLYEIDHAFDLFKEKQNGATVKIGDIEITYKKDAPTGEEAGRKIAEEVNKTPKPAASYFRSVAK